jgi:hypothetical protein
MFIDSRILCLRVRRLEACRLGHCVTQSGRHEGCHARSGDEGYTGTEAVADGTVAEGSQTDVVGKPERRSTGNLGTGGGCERRCRDGTGNIW